MASRGTGGRGQGESKHLYTPETLAERCDEYFNRCEADGKRPTRPGLCLWLDLSIDTLRRYEEGKGRYGELAGAVKKAMLRMQDALEQREDSKSIFLLKQPCYGGYSDRPGDDKGGNVQVNITFGGQAEKYGK